MISAILCEGRSSDRPFLAQVFCSLFGYKEDKHPGTLWNGWTIVRSSANDIIAIQAGQSLEGVLNALHATAAKAQQDGWRHLAVVVDLNGGTIDDRRKAVAGRLEGQIPPIVNVIGVGDRNPVINVIDGQNLDQVIARIGGALRRARVP